MSARAAMAAVGIALATAAVAIAGSSGADHRSNHNGARETCATRSGADFPRAYVDSRNLVVGPLALVGGSTYSSPEVVRRFGGNKFPLLVKAGHTVTLKIPARARSFAGLAYGPLPEGETHLRHTHHAVTFVACDPGERSGSTADGPVTFWSGGVITDKPACVALDVYVDDQPARRVGVPLGRRCGPAQARPPLRDCRSRAEGPGPPAAASRPGDVVVGPFAFAGLDRVAGRRGLDHHRAGRIYLVKAGALVQAGTRATLVIAPEARDWVSLSFATRRLRSVSDGDHAVRFHACRAEEPAFAYDGPVGAVTGFAGGFILGRPGCVPLEVRVAGRPTVRARIPFGVGRCGR